MARAKARAGASKVEARAFSKATRADGRVNRPEGERPEEEKEEECMETKGGPGGKGCFNCGKEGHISAHCPLPKMCNHCGST